MRLATHQTHRRAPLFGLLLVLIACAGCDSLIPPRPPIGKESSETENAIATNSVVSPASVGQFKEPWQTWYVHRLGSQIVGVTEIEAERPLSLDSKSDETLVEFRRDEQLLFRAGRTQFLRHTITRSTETELGEVKKLDLKLRSGPIEAAVFGGRTRNRINLTWSGAIERESVVLDWPEKASGLFALEQTLRREPMNAGETRRIESLMPSLSSFGWIQLQCLGRASVALLDGNYESLMEIEAIWFEKAKPVESLVIWANDSGSVLKTLQPATRVESFAVDENESRRVFQPRNRQAVLFELGKPITHENAEPIDEASNRFLVRYQRGQEETSSRSLRQLIFPIANQSVRVSTAAASSNASIDVGEIEVSVGKDHPKSFQVDESRPDVTDSAPTKLVNSDHNVFRKISSGAWGTDDAEKAASLANEIRNRLSLAPLDTFSSAAEILRSGQGGIFDHAIALTAALRSAGLPAKVVFGLARVSDEAATSQRMQLSAWVACWYDDQWNIVDPVTAKFGDTNRICLLETTNDTPLIDQLAELFRKLPRFQVFPIASPSTGV
ncbi:MAG: transglutaminase-like domain-containing protein [Planctomycetota bacterium]